ncbi:MAG: hypothetical protein K6F50_01260 [Kiritimatiellae bacterium]|nr:hypothetical protein [Kiritimatiellia bacterium]
MAIGSTQYGSLSAALSAAESGDTITALVDGLEVSEDSSIAVTLDLDGHTATISAALTNLSITNAGGITFYESLADDGVISASITWSGSASVTVIGNNGAIISNATVTTSGSTTTVKFAPTVSGTACLYDWTFTNTLASVGTDTTSLNYDTGYSASNAYISSNAFTYGYALNTLATPYTSGGVTYPDSWTCLIAGIVPDLDYSALITFGTQSGGVIGLISTSDTDVLLVRTTGNSAYETLASMTVANARTASHTYAFVKTTSSITVYLDGKLWNVTAVDSPSFGAQLQVGSVHGGVGSTGIKSAKDATAGQSSIQAVRIVSSALGANAIAAFAEEFPYVSPSGNSTRTVTEASETWEQADAWTITTNGVSTTADAPLAGSAITITTTEGVVTTLTCDLEASETYEAITVDGPGSLVFATTDSGAASYTITAAQSAVDEAAVTIKNAVLNLTGGPFTTSNSGSVKFNFDYYSVATATSAASIHLTGVSTSSASVTGEVTGETGDRTLTVSFDSDNSIWIATITCSRSAMNLYISGTSLADGEVCYDSADLTGTAYYPFEGDTLYIDSMTEDSALTISTTYAFPLVFGSSTDKSFTSITAGGAVTLSGAGNLTLTGTDAGTYVIGSTGNLVFAPSDSATYSGSVSLGTDATGVTVISNGTLTISGTIDTDVTVSSGATAKFGVYNAFGGTDEAAGSHTVTVYGTLDINGIAGVNNYTLAEGGVLANTGSHIGTTSRQTTELTLASNATVNAAYNFGLLGSGYGATTITLNGNTLTKTGSAAFWLCNTTTDSSGAIVVSEGTLNVTPGGESHNNGITNYTSTISVPVTVNSGATLSINCNSTFAEIKGAGTVSSDMSATPVVTNLDFSAGLTVSCNMKLADGATVTMPTEGAATFGGTLSSESGAKVTFAYGDRTPAVGDVIIDYTDFTSLYGCSATIEVTGLPSNMATKVTDDGLVVYKRPLMIIIR